MTPKHFLNKTLSKNYPSFGLKAYDLYGIGLIADKINDSYHAFNWLNAAYEELNNEYHGLDDKLKIMGALINATIKVKLGQFCFC